MEANQKSTPTPSAINIPTLFARVGSKQIAYRTIGKGNPLFLCNRFRGILDSWDPAFIDALAEHFQVFLFDYSGVGRSAGKLAITMTGVAEDLLDLTRFLNVEKFVLAGWSYGGMVAQTFATSFPEKVSALILLGTNPPGANAHPPEELFVVTSAKPVNDFEDEVILFFEPQSPFSRKMALVSHERIGRRTDDHDIPVPVETQALYRAGAEDFYVDHLNARDKLTRSPFPVLVISGDHDLVFPIENWYAFTRLMPQLQIIMLGQAGHGPQHQYPYLVSSYIVAFKNHTDLA